MVSAEYNEEGLLTALAVPRHHQESLGFLLADVNQGAALYSLIRNIGMSIGVSIVVTMLARWTQDGHAALGQFINPFSFALRSATDAGAIDPGTPLGLALLDGELTRQAATLAYLADFRLMMWVTIAAIPLIALLRPRKAGTDGAAASGEA